MRWFPSPKIRRAAMVVTGSAALLVIGASCQQPDNRSAERISKLETSVAGVSSIATRVHALEGKDQGVDGQMGSLNQSIAQLQAAMEEVSKEVDAAQGSDSALKKKVDAMAGQVASVAAQTNKIGAIEQKLALLETRYNDHLRKYHGG
ncbi:MAG: hypothetical protein ACT4OM_09705 [Actinomycetota bacterium]